MLATAFHDRAYISPLKNFHDWLKAFTREMLAISCFKIFWSRISPLEVDMKRFPWLAYKIVLWNARYQVLEDTWFSHFTSLQILHSRSSLIDFVDGGRDMGKVWSPRIIILCFSLLALIVHAEKRPRLAPTIQSFNARNSITQNSNILHSTAELNFWPFMNPHVQSMQFSCEMLRKYQLKYK